MISDSDSDSMFITQDTYKNDTSSLSSSEFDADDFLSNFPVVEDNKILAGSSLDRQRLGTVKTDSEIESLIKSNIPDATRRKMNWAYNSFETWQASRNKYTRENPTSGLSVIEPKLLEMTDDELNYSLARFVQEVKKVDGSEYPANTLFEMICSIQKYLQEHSRKVQLLQDDIFRELQRSLDAVMKSRNKEGLGLVKKQARIITLHEETILWEKGLLGKESGETLVNTMVYLFGLNFALRAGQEHRNIRWKNSQIVLKTCCDSGRRYLEYMEDVSKTNQGGLKNRGKMRKSTRAYENVDDRSRCIVTYYEFYNSKW